MRSYARYQRADSTSLTSIQQSIADAELALATKTQTIPPDRLPLDQAPRAKDYTKNGKFDLSAFTKAQKEFEEFQMDVRKRYDDTTAPYRPAILRARQPLQDAEYARVTGRSSGRTVYPFDRIDEYGQPTQVRTYVKGNRILGVVLIAGEERTGYNFNENCELTKLTASYVKNESSGIRQDIAPRTCEQLPALKASLNDLPTDHRDFADTCAAIGATFSKSMCQCPNVKGKSEFGINPWAEECTKVPPERLLVRRLKNEGTFTFFGQRSEIEGIIARCEQSRSLWAPGSKGQRPPGTEDSPSDVSK